MSNGDVPAEPGVLRSELALWVGALTTVVFTIFAEALFSDFSNPSPAESSACRGVTSIRWRFFTRKWTDARIKTAISDSMAVAIRYSITPCYNLVQPQEWKS